MNNNPIIGLCILVLAAGVNAEVTEPPQKTKLVSIYTSVEASSEPVPVRDMIHGWDSSAKAGEYAFADAIIKAEYRERNYLLALESRWFNSLEFTPGTVDWYLEVDQGIENDYSGDIELSIQSFDAVGVSIGYEFQFDWFSLTPVITRYQLNHYQFGDIEGVAYPGQGIDVSATLEYYFDEDKILEYDAQEGNRTAYSLSLLSDIQATDNIRIGIELRDAWNRFKLSQASFRTGCINLGTIEESICNQGGSSVEGVDGNKDVYTDIPLTLISKVDFSSYGVEADLYWHNRYLRLGIAKDWMIGNDASAGLMLTSLNQIGLRAKYKLVTLQYMVDDHRISEVRDGRLFMGIDYAW